MADQHREEQTGDRHSDGEHCHQRRGDDHGVAEAAQTNLLAESVRACCSDRRDDFAPLRLDRPRRLPLVELLVSFVLAQWIRIADTDPSGDPLDSCRPGSVGPR